MTRRVKLGRAPTRCGWYGVVPTMGLLLPISALAFVIGVMCCVDPSVGQHSSWLVSDSAHTVVVILLAACAPLVVALAVFAGGVASARLPCVCVAALAGLSVGQADERAWRSCCSVVGVPHADSRELIRLSGRVATAPLPSAPVDARLHPMTADRQSVRFACDLLATDEGDPYPWPDAVVQVRVGAPIVDVAIGDRVTITGWITPMRPATNPGGYDMARWARARWVVGAIFVDSQDAIVRGGRERAWLPHWRESLVRSLQSMLSGGSPDSAALAVAMTLGPTAPDMHDVAADCQITGLTHVLALSGFNVGLLIALAARCLGPLGARGWMRGLIMVGCACLFIASASAGIAAQRAGVAAIAGTLVASGLMRMGAWHAASLVAVCVVAFAPGCVVDIGFQLSAVVALVLAAFAHSAPVIADAWWRPHWPAPTLMRGVIAVVIVSAIACAASTPIVAHHFGSVTPMVIPGTIVAAPLSAVVVTSCTLALVVHMMCPPLAWLFAQTACAAGACFIWLVDLLASVPLGSWSADPISGWWCVVLLIAVVVWIATRSRRLSVLMVSLLFVSAFDSRTAMRVTMLDVANGSAWLVQRDSHAVLVDAGSMDRPGVGARTVVPALRALGVRTLDAIALSHGDLDHINAVPSVLDAMRVRWLLVTREFIESACPGTVGERILEQAWTQGTRISVVWEGDEYWFGDARWTALHPPANVAPRPRNEGSISWLVESSDATLLLTGDVEQQGASRLMAHAAHINMAQRPLLMELPHHGSFRPAVAALMDRLKPDWVGQSTGSARLRLDRWASLAPPAGRSVTARDGASRVGVMDGVVIVEDWKGRWQRAASTRAHETR